jgi:hypothetical protein
MNPRNIRRTAMIALSFLSSFASYAQLNVKIKGGNVSLCKGQTITLADSVISGSPTTYRWKSNLLTIADSTKNTTTAVADTSGTILLTTSDGTTTTVDSIFVTVNALPAIKLVDDQGICCDNKSLALNDLKEIPAHIPALGKWTCPSYPFVLSSSDSFLTNLACALIQPTFDEVIIGLYYTLTDSVSGCTNQGTINITVKSLPTVFLKNNYFCQAAQEINLFDKIVVSPIASNVGTFSWNCVQCNGNNFDSMLTDKGTQALPDYWLAVDSPAYKVQNTNLDNISLELVYTNTFGCVNKDTAEISIARTSKIDFGKSAEVCYGARFAALADLTNVNLTGGVWSCIDSMGYRPCGELGGISGDVVNTQNSVRLATSTTTPNSWRINYLHTTTGCTASGRTTLFINPGPDLSLQALASNRLCNTASDVPLVATPAGGTWGSGQLGAIVSNDFKPSKITAFGVPIPLYYTYSDPISRCTSRDSLSIVIDGNPVISKLSDTGICRTQDVSPRFIRFNVSATNTTSLQWMATGNSASRAFLGNPSSGDAYFTFDNATSKDTFQLIVSAEGTGACPDVDGSFKVITTPSSSCVLSTNNIEIDKINIYPNPSKGSFTLENATKYELSIYTTLGEELCLIIVRDSIHMDANRGIYYLRLIEKSTGLFTTKKLLIE